MKTKLYKLKAVFIIAIINLLIITSMFAQSPEKMSYQAVIRNNSNALVLYTQIGMQISILQGSVTGTVVYSEIQTPTTNANGLVSIEIGGGAGFNTIDWSNGPYFIKTETDPTGGTNYTISGTSQLLSVPFALYAKTAENITGGVVETDPVYNTSVAAGINASDINNWDNKISSEVDGSVTNEIQILSINYDTIRLSNGGYVKLPAGFSGNYNDLTNKPTNVSTFTNDAGYLTSFTEIDGDVSNEIQILSINYDTIRLTNGGYVKLPPSNAWSLIGNTGTVDGTNFIGTTDNVALNFKVNNEKAGKIDPSSKNTLFGYQSGKLLSSGTHNTSLGEMSMMNSTTSIGNTALGHSALYTNTTGYMNVALGREALYYNTTGYDNTAVGVGTMFLSTTGSRNTSTGHSSLFNNTTGSYNTANGMYALSSNGTGNYNTAVGYQTLGSNRAGDHGTAIGTRAMGNINNSLTTFTNYNVAVGYEALRGSTNAAANTGNNNTAVGYQTLLNNTSGHENTAIGVFSLNTNTTGIANTAVGQNALYANTIGKWNSAFGCQALTNNIDGNSNTAFGLQSLWANTSGNNNTAIGRDAMVKSKTGNNNVAVGQDAGYNLDAGSNNVFVGYQAGYNETGSNKLYISNSNTSTPLIYGDFSTSTLTVYSNLNINNKYTLPSVDGTTGQVLTSNGAGIVGWNSLAAVANSGSYSDLSNTPVNVSAFTNDAGYLTSFTEMDTTFWKKSGSNIFYNLGNVGIGTNSPSNALSIVGSASFSTSVITPELIPLIGEGTVLTISTNSVSSNTNVGDMIIKGGNNNGPKNSSGRAGDISITGGTFNVPFPTNPATSRAGNVNISGGASPTGSGIVGVGGNVTLTGGSVGPSGTNGIGGAITLVAGSGNQGGNINITAGTGVGPGKVYIQGGTSTTVSQPGDVIISGGDKTGGIYGSVIFKTAITQQAVIDNVGNFGIGVVTPTTKLDVVGGLKVSGTSTDKNISLTGGFGSGIGGEINLMSGYGTNARGGNINIAAGYTSSWAGIGTSSDIYIKGGCMETITSYASVQVGGGKSEVGGTNETAGGDLTLSGGNANLGNQNGGNIILLPGTASGSGENGNVGIGTATPARTLHINAVMRLEPIPTAPSSPSKGDIYFDSTINKLRVYDGTIWQDCW